MEKRVVEALKSLDYKISFAESCTGGLLAATLISVSGASKVIESSFIVYSEKAKQEIVNVSKETLLKYGVTSTEVALEMALGAQNLSGSNVSVGVTGLAGPDGDGINEIGTVCFGIVINDNKYSFKTVFRNRTRDEVRRDSVLFVFNKLIELLEI